MHTVGLKLDVKKAFKRVRVHPSQYRYLLFPFASMFYYWVVLPFGHRVSSLWWQRVGALVGRVASHLLGITHARLLYVDDYLWRFDQSSCWTSAVLVILVFEVLGVPLSYAKLVFGGQLAWVGYLINFAARTVTIPIVKAEKLARFLAEFILPAPLSSRRMEQLVGFLSWVSQQFFHARPFLQHLYSIARGAKSRVHATEQLFRQLFFWGWIFRLIAG